MSTEIDLLLAGVISEHSYWFGQGGSKIATR